MCRHLSANVVSIAETTELLLTGSIPAVEDHGTKGSEERQRVDFNTHSGDIFLFEFTCSVSFNEGGLANTTVSDEDELKLGSVRINLRLQCVSYRMH